LPNWVWRNSQLIEDSPASHALLLEQYRAFWTLLSEQRVPEALAACQLKVRELAAASYSNVADVEGRLELGDMITSPELTLFRFRPEGLRLEVLGFGRLARLVDSDGDYPVVFLENDHSLAHQIPLIYCKTGEDWQIIR
jgi:hypothetical protein